MAAPFNYGPPPDPALTPGYLYQGFCARVAVDDLEVGIPTKVMLLGEPGSPDPQVRAVCLVRLAAVDAGEARLPDRDRFFAIGDRCSHENVSLSEGERCDDEAGLSPTIECWKHGSVFSLVTGESLCPPATAPVPTYRVIREGATLVVTIGEGAPPTPPPSSVGAPP